MPHSILSLRVISDRIEAELKTPIKELRLATPFNLPERIETPIQSYQTQLESYFMAHLRPTTASGKPWTVVVDSISLFESEQNATGKYQELSTWFTMKPPSGENPRSFELFYDGVLHQVVTHKIFVALSQDWQSGDIDTQEKNIGIIELSVADNKVYPLQVNLDEGSNFKGFKAMFWLGVAHIADGTDHLLFLLVLLLPAPLVVENKRWGAYGGARYCFIRLIKIVTAFTVGHSISLFIGAMKWVSLPQQPVEIAIACTILLTAIHALRPFFYNKEILIASGFGLIHGLAFSSVLAELNLDTTEMLIGILGFNIGIESMQLFVLVLTMPWLVILSRSNWYTWVRIVGAILAIIAALAWATERIFLTPNKVSTLMQQIADWGKWLVLALMILAIASLFTTHTSNSNEASTNQR